MPYPSRRVPSAAARIIRRITARLRADERGASAMLMAAGMLPMLAAMGGGVDITRQYMARSQLQAAVDAAALAGARSYAVDDGSPADRDAQVENYFNANFPAGYLGTTGLTLNPTGAETRFRTVNNINRTTVTAEATLPMALMQVFGFGPRTIRVVAKAELQPRPLEVMVVLDNTGSMKSALGSGTRMTALKAAAKSFVDILYQGGENRPELAMGFVMYDLTANVGKLLQAARPGSIATLDGFNDAGTAPWSPTGNPLGWKGCVMADQTVKDVGSDLANSNPGAYDITRSLPGDPDGHPPIQPFFVPPFYVPELANYTGSNPTGLASFRTAQADPTSSYYQSKSLAQALNGSAGDRYNLYKLTDPAVASKAAYRKYFFDYYRHLNALTSPAGDDVIKTLSGGYYPIDDLTAPLIRDRTDWMVDYAAIPNYAKWSDASIYVVNKDGGKTDNHGVNQTPSPSPNWQCPEESIPVAYGRTKSYYKDTVIDTKNGSIYPANGTLHHSGLLWAYRLLVRDDVFKRTNPSTQTPKRAIVFMTDGNAEIGHTPNAYTDRTFSWYGRWSDSRISSDPEDQLDESRRRFAKTCAAIKREANPPKVYIISLALNSGSPDKAFFDACAPGKTYYTSTAAQLNTAFQDVATELVDLHLVQ